MSQNQAKVQAEDPSMEDILASIRKIISDDEPQTADEDIKQEEEKDMAKAAQTTAVEAPFEEDDLLELTDIIEEDEPEINLSEEAMDESTESEEPEETQEEQIEMQGGDSKIISDEVEEASSNAFSQLSDAVSRINAISLGTGSITLESIVRESLKPLLKQWLDTHLAGVVEGVVKEEVSKIVKKIDNIR
jgi:uncharacterized protein